MGHLHPKRLPRTPSWLRVVDLLESGGPISKLAAATAEASEPDLVRASRDPALTHSFWLLTQLPQAAQKEGFGAALADLGFDEDAPSSLPALLAKLSGAVRRNVDPSVEQTDLGEMATLSAAESLSDFVGRELPSLFGPSSANLRLALAQFATRDRFAELSRDYFARLTFKIIDYYISRALPQLVGPGRAIDSIAAETEFRNALQQHCRDASLIVENFSSQWFSKMNREGGITPTLAQGFAAVALQKMRDELKARGTGDG